MKLKLTYETLRKLVLEEMQSNGAILESPEVLAEKSILKNKNPLNRGST